MSNQNRERCFFMCEKNDTSDRAKNWRSHGRQWRVKTDQGHQS